MRKELESYCGKVVRYFTFEREVLTFQFQDGDTLKMFAQGDCCSGSWFEQIAGGEALASGAVVKSIELIDLDKLIKNDEFDHLQFYGVKIITSLGYADIDMRNSSNGYYGGFITINDSGQYSGDSIYPEHQEVAK